MDGLSFKDQLQLYYKADIVVSPHSASFINLIFSVPHTVVVECFPPYFFEMWYSNTAMISRLHYRGDGSLRQAFVLPPRVSPFSKLKRSNFSE